jgi:hypothetical protein
VYRRCCCFPGSLHDPERVLDWLTSQDMIDLKNEIEEVSRKMLDKLLQENDFIAIFFCTSLSCVLSTRLYRPSCPPFVQCAQSEAKTD